MRFRVQHAQIQLVSSGEVDPALTRCFKSSTYFIEGRGGLIARGEGVCTVFLRKFSIQLIAGHHQSASGGSMVDQH